MNWLKTFLIFSAALTLAGCGVKGDPLPPEKPADLGRGRPTYKGATEGIQIDPGSPAAEGEEDEEEDEDK